MRYIFVDMDNTIAENRTPDDLNFHTGLYLSKRPVRIMLDAISTIYKKDYIIILSKTAGDTLGKTEKLGWLALYFPNYDEAYFIKPDESKSNFIFNYCGERNIPLEDCLIIDDKKITLQKCKQMGMQVKYPMQLICDYEELNYAT